MRPNSAWGSIETATIGKAHPILFENKYKSLQPEVQECEVRIPQWEKQACDNFSSPRVSVHRLCQKCPRHITKCLNAAAKKLDN